VSRTYKTSRKANQHRAKKKYRLKPAAWKGLADRTSVRVQKRTSISFEKEKARSEISLGDEKERRGLGSGTGRNFAFIGKGIVRGKEEEEPAAFAKNRD